MRGRALDFEELRADLPGDDVRAFDWRVTVRPGLPHARVYREERERPALLVVDQRVGMFSGTKLNLKSVTAAEAGAFTAWCAFLAGDRLGAVVFDDASLVAFRPHRSRGQVLRILEAIVAKNQALHADSEARASPAMLNRALDSARRLAGHDHLVAIVSDFDGVDSDTRRLVTDLLRHNDVTAMLVTDPSSPEPPDDGRLPLTRELGVPVMALSTAEDVATQIRHLLGRSTLRRQSQQHQS